MIILGNRIKKYTYTGSTQYFTVPANITTIYVSACGGGGGAGSASAPSGPAGSGGGATSMGIFPTILFTLAGGGGGPGYPGSGYGVSGGWGGSRGCAVDNGISGGSSLFGIGGTVNGGTNQTSGTGYGAGGAGQGTSACGGGGAGCYLREPIAVTPGTTYPITIGNGGAGSGSGGNGTPGFVLIEW